jgi:hypothetical protein
LTPSWFDRGESKTQAVAQAVVKGSALAKESMTFLAPFHMAQLGIHGVEHKVNPFTVKPIDLTNEDQRLLASRGLNLINFDAEGLFSAKALKGMTEAIPFVNQAMDAAHSFSKWQFEHFIPNLKMDMAVDAFHRNLERFPKLSREQAAELTAKQANAAFGNLNHAWDAIPRTKTFSTLLRLATFAPDFLESRMRFVGQAFTKYGTEQRAALIRGALVMYAAARIGNYILNNGDAKWDPEHAFSLVVNGKSYSLRTVQGDLMHAVTDPRGFIYNRLNPLTTRPLTEFLSGRDEQGRQKSAVSQIKDYGKTVLPFGAQKVIQTPDESWLNSLLTSTGLQASNYRTPTEEAVHKLYLQHIPDLPDDEEREAQSRERAQLEQAVREGKKSPADVWALARAGKLTNRQAARVISRAKQSKLQLEFAALGSAQIKDALDIYAKANPAEQMELHAIMERKRGLVQNLPEDEREATQARMNDLLNNPFQKQ